MLINLKTAEHQWMTHGKNLYPKVLKTLLIEVPECSYHHKTKELIRSARAREREREREREISRNNSSFTLHLTKLDYGTGRVAQETYSVRGRMCLLFYSDSQRVLSRKASKRSLLGTQMNLR